ncbi:hypothetical protein K458DRAFT_328526 [Lentithecium fluviatile CBS 122367]|uniref:Uncharacterized protein n=1 Tax=Lentithecium fluviatile CBS 122367 TaxID=1168545 RepID=A0A6G1JJA5_9PLEO|nr:hypothetical protein K458DRAFT_328526 [Lentithecium fluviatile CBS 122367]
MAPRPRAVSLFESDDFESSPDPLATSMNQNNARGRRQTTRSKQPLTSSSPSKQNRASSYVDLEAASPSKSMVLSTPRGGGASPWRIKVTVQAEPGSGDENVDSPSVKRVTRTKTTTIPLKDADATSPVKRRGRPRKSDATSAKAKRSGTPARKAAQSKTRTSSIGVEGSAADVDTDAPPKRRRGRPRKSIQPPTEDEAIVADEREPTEEQEHISAEDFPAQETTVSKQTSLEDGEKSDEVPTEDDIAPAQEFTPPQSDLSQRIRARKGTPANKGKVTLELSSDEKSDEDSDIHTPSGTDEEAPEARERAASTPEDFVTFEAPEDDDYEDAIQNVTNFAFEEGATRMPDDTTILESENFSMVSVDSLPSGGGLTSPVYGPAGLTTAGSSMASIRNSEYLRIPSADVHTRSSPENATRPSPDLSRTAQPTADVKTSPPVASQRHKTPSIDTRLLSNPPPIEPARFSPTEAETPKIGRVVKAGVALQVVLDPSRATPERSPSKIIDEDIFRGFSERTRRELQAGLRLGEQLAQLGPSKPNSPVLPSPIKPTMQGEASDDVFARRVQQRSSRLLTPEDQDDCMMPTPPATQPADVQYPSLNVSEPESQLLSPARSEDEMSWRVDTPPVRGVTAGGQQFMAVSSETDQAFRGRKSSAVTDVDAQVTKDNHADMWEEEASRSSNSPQSSSHPAEGSPQLQDLFAQEGLVKPIRGKLPRTWRCKSAGNFQYSDEAEESPEPTPSSTEFDEAVAEKVDKGKSKMLESVIQEQQDYEEDDMSEASDDTGMFFTNNLPNIFNKRRSTELRKKKAEKLDLSLLMQEGESLLPESSPPVAKSQTPGASKLNPFLDTPPRFAAFQSSPVKSSPLRKEIRASDTSSESVQQGFEESTLPLAPSSPFHTLVDGESIMTTASDQRQFQQEMAGTTDSSLRNIRNEADGYLDAYEPQERTLGEIEEVTEPSRTLNRDSTIIPQSSPVKQAFEESMLRPARTYPPLFGGGSASESSSSRCSKESGTRDAAKPAGITTNRAEQQTQNSAISQNAQNSQPYQSSQPSSGIFGRLTSTLWTALGSAPPPPTHPILAKFDRLPKVEPWTKTHYKTLDALYQRHKGQPTLFLPSSSSNATNTNNAILEDFLRTHKRPFIDARYSAWGYFVTLDESLVVLCAVFMQLLVLKDVWEYEKLAGKEIQMGDCGPGESGVEISAEEVVRRLATVIMGEDLRRDEKRGFEVDRRGGLTIMWPA